MLFISQRAFLCLSLPATDAGVVIVGGGSGGFTMVIGLRESGYIGSDLPNIYMLGLYHSVCWVFLFQCLDDEVDELLFHHFKVATCFNTPLTSGFLPMVVCSLTRVSLMKSQPPLIPLKSMARSTQPSILQRVQI